jgi:hypothetical protein
VGADWAEPLKGVQGVEIVGDSNPYRLRIEATERGIEIARQKLAELCYIEPVRQIMLEFFDDESKPHCKAAWTALGASAVAGL